MVGLSKEAHVNTMHTCSGRNKKWEHAVYSVPDGTVWLFILFCPKHAGVPGWYWVLPTSKLLCVLLEGYLIFSFTHGCQWELFWTWSS